MNYYDDDYYDNGVISEVADVVVTMQEVMEKSIRLSVKKEQQERMKCLEADNDQLRYIRDNWEKLRTEYIEKVEKVRVAKDAEIADLRILLQKGFMKSIDASAFKTGKVTWKEAIEAWLGGKEIYCTDEHGHKYDVETTYLLFKGGAVVSGVDLIKSKWFIEAKS